MSRKIKIFDCTLRDGEQSLGINLNIGEKLVIAKKLEELGVDIIEAGFPILSNNEFMAVQKIAMEIKKSTVSALCRAVRREINVAYEAIKGAENGRIHTFIYTSQIGMKYKTNMSESQTLETAVEAVKYSKKFCNDIEFSAEDAYRSDINFLCRLLEKVIEAGATVINIPDTFGDATPNDFRNFIRTIVKSTAGIERVDVSVHCHNDLGMAVANSLAGIIEGATQVGCTMNGFGEKSGNTALEEIAMVIETRKRFLDINSQIITKNILRTSRLVSSILGTNFQPNKSIIGENALSDEFNQYQDGILKEKSNYDVITPEVVEKINANNFILDKLSVKYVFDNYIKENSINIDKEIIAKMFNKFLNVTINRDKITYREIEAIINAEIGNIDEVYKLISYQVYSGSKILHTTSVEIDNKGIVLKDSSIGEGTISSAFRAVERAIGRTINIKDYTVKNITNDKDALINVIVKIEEEGKIFIGNSVSIDTVEASINAFLNAINKMIIQLN